MLQQMRTGAKSIFLKSILFGLLLLATIGLAFMDVQGMFRQGVSDSTVAKVGSEKITAPEFDRMVQIALRNQGLKQQEAYLAGFPRMVLEQEINSRLFAMESRRVGLEINDALVAAELKKILQPLKADGLSDQAALDQLLRAYDMNEAQLVSVLKSQIAAGQLLQNAFASVRAPAQMKKDAARYRHETREGQFLTLSAAHLKETLNPTDEDLRRFYDANTEAYVTPEYRALSVLVLDEKSLSKDLKVSPEAVKAHYDDHIDDYTTAETRTISQAILKEETAAKEFLARAQKEKSLEKAAQAFDAGKANILKAGDYTKAEMAAELAEAAFAAQAGDFIGPIQSPFGWHILHVQKTTPARTTSFEEARAGIESSLLRDLAANALYDRANKIDDAVASGKTLADISKEEGLDITSIAETDSFGKRADGKDAIPSLPSPSRLLEEAFSLEEGKVSSLVETPEGSFLLVGVDKIMPAVAKPFEKIKTDVRGRLIAERKIRALAEMGEKMVSRLQSGESLEKLAAEAGVKIEVTGAVQRGQTPEEAKMDRPLMNALFSLDQTGDATTVHADEKITVLRLSSRKIPSDTSLKDDLAATMEDALDRSMRQSLLDQYRGALAKKYKVTINDKAIEKMYAVDLEGESLE